MLRHLLSVLPLLALAACTGGGGDVGIVKSRIDNDSDGFTADVDCDDTHADVNPDAAEHCDGVDEDCDDVVDNEAIDAITVYTDLDGDTYGDPATEATACEAGDHEVTTAGDCDDADLTAFPGAAELCDGVDNDCDGTIDDGASDPTLWYMDADEDGYGDPAVSVEACDAPEGYVALGDDCDDTNAAIHPDAVEDDCADATDYNCDGSVGFADADGDGSPACEDCDDADEARAPTLTEVCDEADTDEDCSGAADDDDAGTDSASMSAWYRDVDADGYATGTGAALVQCEQPTGYTDLTGDCDDYDSGRSPGETEVCDATNTDEDCDSLADDADVSVDAATWVTYYRDSDADTYGDSSRTIAQCDAPANYVANSTDCDDTDADRNPGETEVCDAADKDEDCDGLSDDSDTSASGTSTWYADADGDTYGLSTTVKVACEKPTGYVSNSSDCDDTSASVSPAGTELCDASNKDEDCDGLADDLDSAASGKSTWYKDTDGDTYGLSTSTTSACDQPSAYASRSGDCDDANTAVSPAATELCDSANKDEDCDSLADDLDSSATGKTTWYRDADSDTYGTSATSSAACDQPSGYVSNASDCNDGSSSVSPVGSEICDSADADEDCDGLADDADSSVSGKSTWYIDGDSDGYGLSTTTTAACNQPSGYAAVSGDCNDGSSAQSPAKTELCDSANLDEDCDYLADDADSSATGKTTWYKDTDGDSYGATGTTSSACDQPSTYVATGGDCDETSTAINPAATELCDSANKDEDCDGLADDLDSSASGKSTWYKDADGDTYGAAATTSSACDQPSTYVSRAADCDDTAYTINPAGTEVCDAADKDEDCDGLADDADSPVSGGYTFYLDADSDGYGVTSSTATRCSAGVGYSSLSGDCDDTSTSVNPGGAESCSTTADDDCDGDTNDLGASACTSFYKDTDHDTYGAGTAACYCEATSTYSVSSSSDCDDAVSTAYPGATEVCGDGIDQDCSGADTTCPTVSSLYTPSGDYNLDWISTRIEGASSSYYLGQRPSVPADFNGDGVDDLLILQIGATGGSAALLTGPFDGSTTASSGGSTLYVSASTSADGLTTVNRIGDQDGDGYEDFAVGNPGYESSSSYVNAGAVYIFSGRLTGATTASSTYPMFTGESVASGNLGQGVAPAGDTNDDGYDDFFVSATGAGSSTHGKIYLLEGPFAVGSRAVSTYASTTWTGESSASYAGIVVVGDVDLNNDGDEDMLFSAPSYSSSTGRVYIYEGPFASGAITAGSTTATAVITGKTTSDYFGHSSGLAVIPDMNGDGYDEIAVGAYANDDAATNAGKVYVFFGPLSGTVSLADADITVSGVASSDYCGFSVGGVEDMDGDGGGELLVGCYAYDYAGTSASGAGLLFYSGAVGALDALDADAVFYGGSSTDYGGYTVGPAGDFDDDGVPDLYVGAYVDEYVQTSNSGLVYLVPGNLNDGLVNAASSVTTYTTNTGYRVSTAGDFNNDGYDDVWASSATSLGYATLVLGPLGATEGGDATLSGDAASDGFGYAIDGGARFNTDAYADSVVGAYLNDQTATSAGEVYIITGRSTPISYAASTSAFAQYQGTAASDYFGYAVSVVDDWDGDGIDDFIGGAYGYSSSTGRAWLVCGPYTGQAGLITTYADSTFTSSSSGVIFAYSVDGDGDIDGDGYADVIIGSIGWDSPSSNAGAAFVYFGGANGTFTTTGADAVLEGVTTGDQAGYSVAIVGDYDKDGKDDLVVGAPSADPVGTGSGSAYLFLGSVSGTISLSSADGILNGTETGEGVGMFVDGAGDLNGDTYADFAVGSIYSDREFTDAGTVRVLYGPDTTFETGFTWHGPSSGAYAGAVGGAGDTNNDGYDDLLIGGYGAAKAWLLLGE
jgi:hypothetical protein